MSDAAGSAPSVSTPPASWKPEDVALARERLRPEQSLQRALLFGLVAALGGAVAWAMVTYAARVEIGWMAVGVGFLVGWAVRTGGRGFERSFQIAGAALSLLGCLLGNLLAVCVFVSEAQQIPLTTILSRLNLAIAADLLVQTFNPMDLVFYGIALYEGYRFSLRRLTPQDVDRALGRAAVRTEPA